MICHDLLFLNMDFSYLMVSSVVGFYSSSLFCCLLPRVKDTNLTQVCHSLLLQLFRFHAAKTGSVLRIVL